MTEHHQRIIGRFRDIRKAVRGALSKSPFMTNQRRTEMLAVGLATLEVQMREMLISLVDEPDFKEGMAALDQEIPYE